MDSDRSRWFRIIKKFKMFRIKCEANNLLNNVLWEKGRQSLISTVYTLKFEIWSRAQRVLHKDKGSEPPHIMQRSDAFKWIQTRSVGGGPRGPAFTCFSTFERNMGPPCKSAGSPLNEPTLRGWVDCTIHTRRNLKVVDVTQVYGIVRETIWLNFCESREENRDTLAKKWLWRLWHWAWINLNGECVVSEQFVFQY